MSSVLCPLLHEVAYLFLFTGFPLTCLKLGGLCFKQATECPRRLEFARNVRARVISARFINLPFGKLPRCFQQARGATFRLNRHRCTAATRETVQYVI